MGNLLPQRNNHEGRNSDPIMPQSVRGALAMAEERNRMRKRKVKRTMLQLMSKQRTTKTDEMLCPTNEELLAYGTIDTARSSLDDLP
jgi:hypothetical protein